MKCDVYILHAAQLKTSHGCKYEVFWGRRKIFKRKKATKKRSVSNSGGSGSAAASRRDDDRVKWRDSRCPLDVTTATNVLAPASQAALSAFFPLEKNTNKHGAAPTQMSSCCVAPLFFFSSLFFTMATVQHADGVAWISLELGTFRFFDFVERG